MLKAKIVAPVEATAPAWVYGELVLPIVADMGDEGGFLQVIVGENPMAIATPGIQLPKGCMLAVITAPIAAVIRPGLNRVERPKAGIPVI